MKNLIIERIKALYAEKQELKKIPFNPNEMELSKDISDLLKKELDSLIEEGSIAVAGITINRHRILSINNKIQENENITN
jgi:hypothetical protein